METENKIKIKKTDPELKRKIKEAEAKKREEAMASVEVTLVAPADQAVEKVSFDQWWMMLNGKMKLRPHMKEIIWADMKARGLSKSEAAEAYDKALKLFGL